MTAAAIAIELGQETHTTIALSIESALRLFLNPGTRPLPWENTMSDLLNI